MADRSIHSAEAIVRILERARWAPSGDNTQPWRFQIVAEDKVIVHGNDTRDEILYDFDGHASHMAHGALLETMRIAASVEGLAMTWRAQADDECRRIQYAVCFERVPGVAPDPFASYIEVRTVQRRPMRLAKLSETQRQGLIEAVGAQCRLQFFESFQERKKIAALLWDNAYIRLSCPEAFSVHKSIIEWGACFSKDRIPERAVGVDPATAKLMRWVMHSWGRVQFFNRYLMGTIAPRIQLDYIPGLFCAAHLLIRPNEAPQSLEDWARLGMAMQRVWLTATRYGLHIQPEMTPVIFRWYVQSNKEFSANAELAKRAAKISADFEALAQATKVQPFGFFCRVGNSSIPPSRSIRLDLTQLFVEGPH